MTTYVYRHIRLDKNEPFYIGIGTDVGYKRAYSKHSRNKYWKRVVGKTKYEVEILFDNLTKEEAKQKEIEFIALYGKKLNKTGTLVNITDGGESTNGYRHTEETKKKIAEANKYKDYSKMDRSFMQTSEYKEKISRLHKGKRLSEEMKQQISKRMKARILTEEQKGKLRNLRLGTKMSEETKLKMKHSAYIGWEKRKMGKNGKS